MAARARRRSRFVASCVSLFAIIPRVNKPLQTAFAALPQPPSHSKRRHPAPRDEQTVSDPSRRTGSGSLFRTPSPTRERDHDASTAVFLHLSKSWSYHTLSDIHHRRNVKKTAPQNGLIWTADHGEHYTVTYTDLLDRQLKSREGSRGSSYHTKNCMTRGGYALSMGSSSVCRSRYGEGRRTHEHGERRVPRLGAILQFRFDRLVDELRVRQFHRK